MLKSGRPKIPCIKPVSGYWSKTLSPDFGKAVRRERAGKGGRNLGKKRKRILVWADVGRSQDRGCSM